MAFPLETNHATPRRTRAVRSLTIGLLAAAACVFAPPLGAQQQPGYSSSSTKTLLAGEDIDGASLASSPATAALPASPQYGGRSGGYSGYHESRWSHVAFEAGGGLTVPVGHDVNGGFTTAIGDGNRYGTDTWGGNFLVGGGWAFSKRFTLLGEYQYDTNKIPGRTLSAIYNGDSANFEANGISNIGGNVHTQSITAEPVFYYYNSDKHTYAGYVIGGAGWSHKSINFTAPTVVESYYGEYVVNQTFNSYSDSGLNLNFGTGVSFKPFGQESRAKLFAEARYTWIDTPSQTAADNSNGNVLHTGTEALIPVTVGIRF